MLIVRRHVGGLEEADRIYALRRRVRRHVGGLEGLIIASTRPRSVRRHVGGLEEATSRCSAA